MLSKIPTATNACCSETEILEAFGRAGALILKGILPASSVRKAHIDARVAFADEGGYLYWQEFSRESKTGYTPSGVEKGPRSGPNFNRHFFDYRPGYVSLDPSSDTLRPIYERISAAAYDLLAKLDAVNGANIVRNCRGGPHLLRIAECLNDTVNPELELFPEHRDFGLLTFFIGGSSAGLEVFVDHGWKQVELDAGDVLVGVGTVLEKYLPHVRALRHRIMASSARRLSLFQFIEPVPEAKFSNGESAKGFLERKLADIR